MRSLLFLAMLSGVPAVMTAQRSMPVDVAAHYNYVHTNAPPTGCGCFNMQGGSGTVLWNLSPRMEPLFKVSVTRANGVNGTSSNLVLTSFLFGARAVLMVHHRVVPYAEASVGVVHATGTLITRNSAEGEAMNTVAATVGGGLRVGLTRQFALEAVQADYYVTQVPNGADGHQNNLLLSTGVLFRF